MTNKRNVLDNDPDERGEQFTADETAMVKQWAASAAPGEEKLAGIFSANRVPLQVRPARPRWMPVVQHFATGGLLFLVGYLVGQKSEHPPQAPRAQAVTVHIQTQPVTVSPAPAPQATPPVTTRVPSPALAQGTPPPASAPPE